MKEKGCDHVVAKLMALHPNPQQVRQQSWDHRSQQGGTPVSEGSIYVKISLKKSDIGYLIAGRCGDLIMWRKKNRATSSSHPSSCYFIFREL